LLLFTDGIYEEFNEDDEEFGEQRIEKIINENKNKTAKQINGIILSELNNWIGDIPVNDDITLIGIDRVN
jgi:serine phosphatase RsbU (regulator of sigma subunit)